MGSIPAPLTVELPPGLTPLYLDFNVVAFLSKPLCNVFSISRISKKFLMEIAKGLFTDKKSS